MKLTQLKRKTFITATGMRKHRAWRPSLQVLQLSSGTRPPLGWWLGSPLAQKLNEPTVATGACGIENGFPRVAGDTAL